MKKFFVMCAIISIFVACGKKDETSIDDNATQNEKVTLSHQSTIFDLKTAKKYNYTNAPKKVSAKSVIVDYDKKIPYAKPITVKYSYASGDTYTFTIPANFGLWKNQAGRFRVITDNDCTVWLQGQTKNGKFMEFVFYGNPKYNGKKIKPNSYQDLPAGKIRYCK